MVAKAKKVWSTSAGGYLIFNSTPKAIHIAFFLDAGATLLVSMKLLPGSCTVEYKQLYTCTLCNSCPIAARTKVRLDYKSIVFSQ